jgi:hypothetical protein
LPYICKDPSCHESVAWHLIHGDLDCIDENRQAVAEFAQAAEARVNPHVIAYLSSPGFADQKVEFDLIPAENIPHSDEDAPLPPSTTDDRPMEM